MGLINGTVSLENNYKLWKKMFIDEKKYLRSIFTKDNFTIEHVGSTAINGLLSKPIIDIAIGVDNLNSITKYFILLESTYTIKANIDKGEILLIKENEIETFSIVHVLPINSKRYINMIKFRDILNNNPSVVKQYEYLKTELANKYKNDRIMYTKTKNIFINEVLKNTNN